MLMLRLLITSTTVIIANSVGQQQFLGAVKRLPALTKELRRFIHMEISVVPVLALAGQKCQTTEPCRAHVFCHSFFL